MKTIWKDIQKHLLSGVSFMMPVVVAGSVIPATSLLGAAQMETGLVPNGPLLTYLNQLGKAGMVTIIPVFAVYISYSVAGKPGLAPGFILGYIADSAIMINGVEVKAEFLEALILGLLTGCVAKWMKRLKIGKTIRSIIPILVIPISTVLVLGLAYYSIIGYPISFLMQALSDLIMTLDGSGEAVLAMFMGFFSEIDFGGPMTKAVSMFTLSMISERIMEPNRIFRVLVTVPPVEIFSSTIIIEKKYSEEERDSAKAIGIMGRLGMTEGAIPYAIKDPEIMHPAYIIENIVEALTEVSGDVAYPVPHGGFIVLPIVGNQLWFVVTILVGSVITTLLPKVSKKDILEER